MESIISRISGNINLPGLSKCRVIVANFFWLIFSLCLIISAFFLGRITKFMEGRPVFSFESKEAEELVYNEEKEKLFNTKIAPKGNIVASSGGKKYYYVWCKGVANLKESKKIYFDSEALAQKAGYTLAASCK